MRRRGRTDGNHTAITKGLRKLGATVQSLADIGAGCPDLLVGFQRRTYLLEVKDGSRPPSERKLTPDETEWHETWRGGALHVVLSLDDAVAIVTREMPRCAS